MTETVDDRWENYIPTRLYMQFFTPTGFVWHASVWRKHSGV